MRAHRTTTIVVGRQRQFLAFLGVGVLLLGGLIAYLALQPPEAQGESAPPPLAGAWHSEHGLVTLSQDGRQVAGTIHYPSGSTGVLVGTLACAHAGDGCVLDYTWGNGVAAGAGQLTLSPDGQIFSGTVRTLRAKGGARVDPNAAVTWTLRRAH